MMSAGGSTQTTEIAVVKEFKDETSAQDATKVMNEACDLRRSHHRDVVERVVSRAQLLPPRERAMVEGVYLRQLSAVDIGRELDIPPRIVRRDVRIIVRRMLSPIFAFVMVHRDAWSGHRRQVAQLVYIEGMSLRAVAAVIGLSFHKTRRHDEAIRLTFEAFEAQKRRAS
ncbi:MAG TPA: hypothetical protein VK157_08345 [Phycisphaerales bacterium]|nr:hypothetical protein [Phycisphaerales bacterium]